MANENNLVPFTRNQSREEAVKNGSKGGKKSGETRRKKRDMKAKMKMLLELPCQNCEDFNSASEMGIDIDEIDNEMVMLVGLFQQAKMGNVKAVKEIRNIIGKDNSSAELELRRKELRLKEQAVKKSENNNNGQLDELIKGLKDE